MSHRMTIFCLALSVYFTGRIGSAQPPITQATIGAAIPKEVVDGSGADLPVAVSALPLDFFDDFSWRSFVALNWPAVVGQRGVADTTKTIKDAGPRVWETWKAAYEIVQPQGAQPSEWASLDAITPCSDVPQANSGLVRILGAHQRFHDFNEAGFGAFNDSGPLVCQNRTYTRYEVRVNKEEFNFIRDKKLYLRSTLLQLQSPLRFTSGSIEVKASWREFKGDEPADFVKTFYTIKAKVQDPVTNTCAEKQMGLVGLHIVQKTPLRPQWVWSSFEHVRNVPKTGVTPNAGDRFSYNDPAKPQSTSAQSPTISPTNPPAANPMPTQVVRELPLHPPGGGAIGTEAANARYQAALAGSVWANYMLVCTQWPTRTKDPNVVPPDNIQGDPFPDPTSSTTTVTNTTLETYTQQFTSCMDCHDAARVSNTDFVFFIQFYSFNDTGFAGLQPRGIDALQEKIRQAKKKKAGKAN